jgi:hypothetical protein
MQSMCHSLNCGETAFFLCLYVADVAASRIDLGSAILSNRLFFKVKIKECLNRLLRNSPSIATIRRRAVAGRKNPDGEKVIPSGRMARGGTHKRPIAAPAGGRRIFH